jgi:hypothetical protein
MTIKELAAFYIQRRVTQRIEHKLPANYRMGTIYVRTVWVSNVFPRGIQFRFQDVVKEPFESEIAALVS